MCILVLLVMFNKAALSSYEFPSANVITLLQVRNFFILVILYIQSVVINYCILFGVRELFDMLCDVKHSHRHDTDTL